MKIVQLFAIFLALAGCAATPDTHDNQTSDLSPSHAAASVSFDGPLDVVKQIDSREEQYRRAEAEVRAQSTIGGGFKGALIGLALDPDPISVLGGAAIGAAVGHQVGENMASRVVLEHRNFVVRQNSLKRIIEAAQLDTNNTNFDLALFKRYHGTPKKNHSQEVISKFEDFYMRALDRQIALKELTETYSTLRGVGALVQEGHRQKEMLSEFARILEYYQ